MGGGEEFKGKGSEGEAVIRAGDALVGSLTTEMLGRRCWDGVKGVKAEGLGNGWVKKKGGKEEWERLRGLLEKKN